MQIKQGVQLDGGLGGSKEMVPRDLATDTDRCRGVERVTVASNRCQRAPLAYRGQPW